MSDRSLVDPEKDVWFGFKGSDLSMRMMQQAALFDQTMTQWLLDNVGEFGDTWWAEIDSDADSMRAVFRDLGMETWVMMRWCDNVD